MARTDRRDRRTLRVREQKLPRQNMFRGRDILRREERLRIAPKHPGMGRR